VGRRVAGYGLLEEDRDWWVALGMRRTVLKQVERAARAHREPSLEPMVGQTLAEYQDYPSEAYSLPTKCRPDLGPVFVVTVAVIIWLCFPFIFISNVPQGSLL